MSRECLDLNKTLCTGKITIWSLLHFVGYETDRCYDKSKITKGTDTSRVAAKRATESSSRWLSDVYALLRQGSSCLERYMWKLRSTCVIVSAVCTSTHYGCQDFSAIKQGLTECSPVSQTCGTMGHSKMFLARAISG